MSGTPEKYGSSPSGSKIPTPPAPTSMECSKKTTIIIEREDCHKGDKKSDSSKKK